jgi:hypothetical protein
MKKLLLLLLFIPLVSFGQKSNDADALKLCVALQSNNFTTDSEAEDAVNKILSVIGASQKPVLQACSNINNAIAAVYKGQRYILYDRDFMNSLTAGSNKYWSNMFILAHEIGHHINGHSLDILLYANDVIDPKSLEERRKQELEADEFAGFVLAKLGASLSQTSKVLSNLPRIGNENSSTHPSKDKRIASVRIGFKNGQNNFSNNLEHINNQDKNEKKEDLTISYSNWNTIISYPKNNLIKEAKEFSNNPIVNSKKIYEASNSNLPDSNNTSSINGELWNNNDKLKLHPFVYIERKPKLTIVQNRWHSNKDSLSIFLENFSELDILRNKYQAFNIPTFYLRVFFEFVIDETNTGTLLAIVTNNAPSGVGRFYKVPSEKAKNLHTKPDFFIKTGKMEINYDSYYINKRNTQPYPSYTSRVYAVDKRNDFINLLKNSNKLYIKLKKYDIIAYSGDRKSRKELISENTYTGKKIFNTPIFSSHDGYYMDKLKGFEFNDNSNLYEFKIKEANRALDF